MNWLDNTWMDNANFLAQMAHFAWAYAIFCTAALFGLSRRGLLVMLALLVCYATAKEFWYDLTFELPNDSFAGSATDFAFYLLGAVVALGVIWFQRRKLEAT